jgi:hypothetical protein
MKTKKKYFGIGFTCGAYSCTNVGVGSVFDVNTQFAFSKCAANISGVGQRLGNYMPQLGWYAKHGPIMFPYELKGVSGLWPKADTFPITPWTNHFIGNRWSK